jgi:hypothetical protein
MSKKKIKIEYSYPEWVSALEWVVLYQKIERLQRQMERNSFFYCKSLKSKPKLIDLSKTNE